MTRLLEETADLDPYPGRQGFRNFAWTQEAIQEWEVVWYALWHIGVKWEWQNCDRYARRRGDIYNLLHVMTTQYAWTWPFLSPAMRLF